MRTIRCPICGNTLTAGPCCAGCGWDTSADSELYPTLFSAAGMPARSARGEKAERRALYLRFGEILFSELPMEALRECSKANDPRKTIQRLLGWEKAGQIPSSDTNNVANWKLNLLRENAFDLFPGNKGRKTVTKLCFRDSLKDTPTAAQDLSTPGYHPVMAWLENSSTDITLVVAGDGGVCAPVNCTMLFRDFIRVRHIDFGGCFHTGGCRSMTSMFHGCRSLEELDLRGFVTSQVIGMNSMFNDCASLKQLDLSSFDTSEVKDMRYMFYNCASLHTLKRSPNFETPQTVPKQYMFYGCTRLNQGDRASTAKTYPRSDLRDPDKQSTSPAEATLGGQRSTEVIVPIQHYDEHRRLLKQTSIRIPAGRQGFAQAEKIPGYHVLGLNVKPVSVDQLGTVNRQPEFIYRRD